MQVLKLQGKGVFVICSFFFYLWVLQVTYSHFKTLNCSKTVSAEKLLGTKGCGGFIRVFVEEISLKPCYVHIVSGFVQAILNIILSVVEMKTCSMYQNVHR